MLCKLTRETHRESWRDSLAKGKMVSRNGWGQEWVGVITRGELFTWFGNLPDFEIKIQSDPKSTIWFWVSSVILGLQTHILPRDPESRFGILLPNNTLEFLNMLLFTDWCRLWCILSLSCCRIFVFFSSLPSPSIWFYAAFIFLLHQKHDVAFQSIFVFVLIWFLSWLSFYTLLFNVISHIDVVF